MPASATAFSEMLDAVEDVRSSFWLVADDDAWALSDAPVPGAAFLPALPAEALGSRAFRERHGLRFAYVTGAMANGIASVEVVEAAARIGGLGFFGSAGLQLPTVAAAVERLQHSLGDAPFGVNFIHSPNETGLEDGLADLLLERGVKLVEASAFLDLTLPIVRYRLTGIRRRADGAVETPNRVVAKVSRVEVAAKFLAPPPAAMVRELVERGVLTTEQADLAALVPTADDLTAEADSGGHTDNRPAIALVPTMLALRDRLQAEHRFAAPVGVGAAGGIATPAGVAAALAMGAAYVVTGSINQACRESGSSDAVRKMLADAGQADVIMAPAADMFEMGVKVQVLKRGTMFAMRGAKLYELYAQYPSWDAVPAAVRDNLEKTVLRSTFAEIWRGTEDYFRTRDPRQLEKAARDPKHQMALVFRWYLGMSSRWANAGEPSRQLDYQVWCGPAMGAFNEWTKGSFLERPEERGVGVVGLNLLYHGAVATRLHLLRLQGVSIPSAWERRTPLPEAELRRRLG